jgi:YidC/Oxa1 family membrane protein insertase
MFEGFFDALASVLNFIYTLVPEGLRPTFGFGFAIMGLTVLVMVLITPLTVKSTRSMLQMQRLQPEMKRLQEKYKDDRETLNQELMAFYREHQINPLGGCLPLLAQMPVFIIMYRLLHGLTERNGGLGSGAGQALAQVTRGVETTPWLFTDQNFNPAHLNPDTALYKALAATNDMNFFGMDLSLSAAQALRIGVLIAIPYFLLLLIMLGTGLFQNRQMQARNTSGNVNPQQQMIMKFMPFFLPIFSFGFPAGLALYWCTQNMCRIGTNAYITRSLYKKEHDEDAAIEAKATEKGTKKNGSKSSDTKAVSATSKSKKESTARSDGPGKSAKSQAAHRKASGTDSTSGTSSNGGDRSSVNSRRSGESRRGSQSSKKK